MAHFVENNANDLFAQLQKLNDVDTVAKKMLNTSIKIVEADVTRRLIGHKQTGDLIDSIIIENAKRRARNDEYSASVTSDGYTFRQMDKSGKIRELYSKKPNDRKLIGLEFGSSTQKPTYVLSKSIKSTENQVLETMQNVFNKECGIE